MAIEFVSVGIVKANGGGSPIGLCAYLERGTRTDNVTGERYHFRQVQGAVLHNEMMRPADAPAAFCAAGVVWEAAERAELIKDGSRFKQDAQFAKHVILALPKELNDEQRLELARDFVARQWVEKGVIAQLVIHEPDGQNGNHHAHVMVSTRRVDMAGFGAKARDLNPRFAAGRMLEKDFLNVAWTKHQNAYFAERGMSLRVDPTAPVPSEHLGKARFLGASERAEANREAARASAEIIARNPAAVLDQLTARDATFTRADVAKALNKWNQTPEEFTAALIITMGARDLVQLTADAPGQPARFTTRAMVETEARMVRQARDLADSGRHGIGAGTATKAIATFEQKAGFQLSAEQRRAVEWVTAPGSAKVVIGLAGSGKSTMIGAAKLAWEAEGYRVIGAALSGVATNNLIEGGLADSNTLAAWERRFERYDAMLQLAAHGEMTDAARDIVRGHAEWAAASSKSPEYSAMAASVLAGLEAGQLSGGQRQWVERLAQKELAKGPVLDSKTVLVIDEAGMIGSRQMARFIARVEAAGAKAVFIGDDNQLQAIEAGASFRVIRERIGHCKLTEVRRQRDDWARAATVKLSRGEVAKAVAAYAERGYIHAGIALDGPQLLAGLARETGPIAAADERHALTVARYVEARAAAGALWAQASKQGEDSPAHAQFREWQARRNAAATEIGADLDACKPWLAKFGVNGKGLAADMLAASGTKRGEAEAQAQGHALLLGLAGIERTVPAGQRLKADYRSGAKAALIEAWAADQGDGEAIILAYTNRDADDLNAAARLVALSRGQLSGLEITVATQAGQRQFAAGDRVVFLAKAFGGDVRNGTLGTVEGIENADGAAPVLRVRTDAGKTVRVDPAKFADFKHGYAVTIHKSQGVTVKRAYALATSSVTRNLAYVFMSRHRLSVRVFAAAADGVTPERLGASMSRADDKDSTLDYAGRLGDSARETIRQQPGRPQDAGQSGKRIDAGYDREFAKPGCERAQPHLDAASGFEAPQSLNGVRTLSGLAVARDGERRAVLLPGHENDKLAHGRAGQSDHALRRADHGAVAAESKAQHGGAYDFAQFAQSDTKQWSSSRLLLNRDMDELRQSIPGVKSGNIEGYRNDRVQVLLIQGERGVYYASRLSDKAGMSAQKWEIRQLSKAEIGQANVQHTAIQDMTRARPHTQKNSPHQEIESRADVHGRGYDFARFAQSDAGQWSQGSVFLARDRNNLEQSMNRLGRSVQDVKTNDIARYRSEHTEALMFRRGEHTYYAARPRTKGAEDPQEWQVQQLTAAEANQANAKHAAIQERMRAREHAQKNTHKPTRRR